MKLSKVTIFIRNPEFGKGWYTIYIPDQCNLTDALLIRAVHQQYPNAPVRVVRDYAKNS